MKNYTTLKAWQTGMEILEKVYQILPYLPEEDRVGLAEQLVKSAAQIPASISESCLGRKGFHANVGLANAATLELERHSAMVVGRRCVPIRLMRELSELIDHEHRMVAKPMDKG